MSLGPTLLSIAGARDIIIIATGSLAILLLIALRFVRPTQMVFRLDQPRR